jgi:nitroreductase
LAEPEAPDLGLLEALDTTRSIHRFTKDPVPEEDLARILWAATRAPSGSNSQPYRFLVLRDGERARKARAVLGETFRRAWSMKSSGEGWKKGSGTDPGSRKARTVAAMQRFVDTFEEIPVVVLVCALRHRAPNPYEGASVYPASQNLLLAARALGYGSTITLWHPMCEAELREILEIPESVFIATAMPIGVPEGGHGPLRRRPVRDLVWEDRWEGPARWIDDPPDARLSSRGSLSHKRFGK